MIAKANQLIHFNHNSSTIYRYNNVDYKIWLEKDELYLCINNEKIPKPIAQYKIQSISTYEYNYHISGIIINDRNKNLTMGKVKKYLNDNDYESLYKYLINPYLLGYEKKLDDQGKIEKLELIFPYGKCYFETKSLQNTFINCYPQRTDILYFVGLYLKKLESLLVTTDMQLMDIEDMLISVMNNQEMKYKDQCNQSEKLKSEIQDLTEKIEKIQDEKSKIEQITIRDINHVVNKFLTSITTKDNVQRLNKSNGTEYQDSLKVTNINKRLSVKNDKTGKFEKISIKKIEKLTLRFISLLDQKNLVINGKTYGFNYFQIQINRDDFNNPYKEKSNIRKNQIDPKILTDFNKFMLILCMDHFSPNTHKPLIYPSSLGNDNMNQWLKVNNNYLSQYGIEIIEINQDK